MKRVTMSALMLSGLSFFASAQDSTGIDSAKIVAGDTSQQSAGKKAKPSEQLNNRKIYKFENGQRSTPTGYEATSSSIGGGYAALGRSEAAKAAGDTVAKNKTVAANKRKAIDGKTKRKE